MAGSMRYPADSNGTVLQPYQITAFQPAFNKDRYESTAWTLNGQFDGLKAVYTGSYMVRHIEGSRTTPTTCAAVRLAYGCIGPGAPTSTPKNFPVLAGKKPLQCYAPVATGRTWSATTTSVARAPHQHRRG